MPLDYIIFLKNLELFQALSDEDLKKILDLCHEVNYVPGDVIFKEGEAADKYYIILNGQVEIWKDYDTPYADILAVKGEGTSFGEMALIDELPRSATIKVSAPTRALYQHKDDFHRIIRENSTIAMFIMKSVSNMVRLSNESFIYGLRQKNQKLEKAYEELKVAQLDLVRSERLSTLGKFSSMILHDLRNPISIIKGYAEMISLNSSDSQRVEQYSAKLIAEADRLNRLAGELLDYSRGNIRLNLSPVQVSFLFQRLEDNFIPLLKAKGISLKTNCQFNEPVLMDQDRILRVLTNLMDNSRKAMSKGGTLQLQAQLEDGQVQLYVMDDGEGMSPEIRDRIFEPFFSSSSAGGTGLGMLVVANVIEAHHGQLSVESEVGKGTAIRISLPISFQA